LALGSEENVENMLESAEQAVSATTKAATPIGPPEGPTCLASFLIGALHGANPAVHCEKEPCSHEALV